MSRCAAVTEADSEGGEAGPRRPALAPRRRAIHLRILDDIVNTVGIIHGLCRVIAWHDPDLARQMKRAIDSVGLNSGEGLFARDDNRTVRIESAMN